MSTTSVQKALKPFKGAPGLRGALVSRLLARDSQLADDWACIEKVFSGDGLATWLEDRVIDAVTLADAGKRLQEAEHVLDCEPEDDTDWDTLPHESHESRQQSLFEDWCANAVATWAKTEASAEQLEASAEEARAAQAKARVAEIEFYIAQVHAARLEVNAAQARAAQVAARAVQFLAPKAEVAKPMTFEQWLQTGPIAQVLAARLEVNAAQARAAQVAARAAQFLAPKAEVAKPMTFEQWLETGPSLSFADGSNRANPVKILLSTLELIALSDPKGLPFKVPSGVLGMFPAPNERDNEWRFGIPEGTRTKQLEKVADLAKQLADAIRECPGVDQAAAEFLEGIDLMADAETVRAQRAGRPWSVVPSRALQYRLHRLAASATSETARFRDPINDRPNKSEARKVFWTGALYRLIVFDKIIPDGLFKVISTLVSVILNVTFTEEGARSICNRMTRRTMQRRSSRVDGEDADSD